jgi:hypothetical protein
MTSIADHPVFWQQLLAAYQPRPLRSRFIACTMEKVKEKDGPSASTRFVAICHTYPSEIGSVYLYYDTHTQSHSYKQRGIY